VRILHLGKYYPPVAGGMERFLQDLAEEQARQGHQVEVFCHQHPRQPVAVSDSNQLPVVHRVPAMGPVLHTPLMRAPRRSFSAVLRRFQPDIVHVHWPNPVAMWLAPVMQRHAVPMVLQWHSDTITERVSPAVKGAYRLMQPLERSFLSRAKAVVCSSPDYARCSAILKPVSSRVRIIPLGMDFSHRLHPPDNCALSDWAGQQWSQSGIRVLSLGRLSFYKNIPLLIKAVADARNDGGMPVHLVVAGEGPQARGLQALSRSLGIQDRVRFTGALDQAQANALFSQCDVFALASSDRAESFGLVLLEALWHGKPVVVANTPGSGMRYVVESINAHAPGGYLFDPCGTRDALEKIRLAAQGKDAPGLSQQLRTAVVKSFSIEPICRQWTELYQSIVPNDRQAPV